MSVFNYGPAPRAGWRPPVLFSINQEKCVSCLACARVCPVEAVAVNGSAVSIVEESCIKCGICVPACPHDAIDAAGDFDRALALAARGDSALILSVEAGVHFYPLLPEQVVNACYHAGFRTVHRGVMGDELVAAEYQRLLTDPDWGTMIRSTCPVVVEKVRAEYPELVPYLAPVKTPISAEALYLKGMYGEDLPIVYAGVCLTEGGTQVDAAITFTELAKLFEARGVEVVAEEATFERIPEEQRRHISTAGGLPLAILQQERQASRRFRKVRGLDQLDAIAHAVAVEKMDLGFLDILPCEGCLDHPLMGPKAELYKRRRIQDGAEPRRSALPVVDPDVPVDIEAAFEVRTNGHHPPARELQAVLARIGTAPSGKPWDCGACGFRTCWQFAEAMLNGRATLRACPPYHEKRASEATEQASVDDLTGLATYRVLKDRLAQELARSSRSSDPFSVLFMDLDRFKQLNDERGHEEGSRVLAAVGQALSRVVRSTDLAARYGGDEFVVVLVRTGPSGAVTVAEAVRGAIEALGQSLGLGAGVVTVSVGIASHDPAMTEKHDVLASADKALYRAKAKGGNAVAADFIMDEGNGAERGGN